MKVYIFWIFYGVFIENTRLESPHHIEYSMVGAEPMGQGLSPSPSMLTPYSQTHKHNNMEGVWSGARTEPKVHFIISLTVSNRYLGFSNLSSTLCTRCVHMQQHKHWSVLSITVPQIELVVKSVLCILVICGQLSTRLNGFLRQRKSVKCRGQISLWGY